MRRRKRIIRNIIGKIIFGRFRYLRICKRYEVDRFTRHIIILTGGTTALTKGLIGLTEMSGSCEGELWGKLSGVDSRKWSDNKTIGVPNECESWIGVDSVGTIGVDVVGT